MTEKAIEPSGPIYGAVTPPGSKSITNRALVIASLADGATSLHGALHADDTLIMRAGLRRLGVTINDEGSAWRVHGPKSTKNSGWINKSPLTV